MRSSQSFKLEILQSGSGEIWNIMNDKWWMECVSATIKCVNLQAGPIFWRLHGSSMVPWDQQSWLSSWMNVLLHRSKLDLIIKLVNHRCVVATIKCNIDGMSRSEQLNEWQCVGRCKDKCCQKMDGLCKTVDCSSRTNGNGWNVPLVQWANVTNVKMIKYANVVAIVTNWCHSNLF